MTSIREQALETAAGSISESIPHLALSSATPTPFEYVAQQVVDALAAAGLLRDDQPERDGESIDYEAISKKAREAFRFVPLGVPDATTRAVIDAAISWERDQASREQEDDER